MLLKYFFKIYLKIKVQMLLSQNQDKIDWRSFSYNPNILELDYQFIKERMDPLKKELMEYCYHPSRINFKV